MGRSDFPKYQK